MTETNSDPRPTKYFVAAAFFIALGLLLNQMLPSPANEYIALGFCVPALIFGALFIFALIRRRGLD